MTTAYIESSALAKLVLTDGESVNLRRSLDAFDHQVSSDLSAVEVTRAAARAFGEAGFALARESLRSVSSIPISSAVIAWAARLAPRALRSLDAIHVATALVIGDADLVFFSYDEHTLDAARAAGLTVASPAGDS